MMAYLIEKHLTLTVLCWVSKMEIQMKMRLEQGKDYLQIWQIKTRDQIFLLGVKMVW